jgi:hypothetical protein
VIGNFPTALKPQLDIFQTLPVHLYLATGSPHSLFIQGLNEIIGATRAIEGSAYWIALVVSWREKKCRPPKVVNWIADVVSWMQTLGSQPVMPKISPITGTRGLLKP